MSINEKIIETDVTEELPSSFMEYAMSVILQRAIPDVRDGLKPVQRRVIYSMLVDSKLLPEGSTSKSATVVGAVMGTYHPHGDSSIYEALVRLAQSERLRAPLIIPKGNFGGLDDGPAAQRYTECKLHNNGYLLLKDVNEDCVDFRNNFSNTTKEPTVLPSGMPNLIINGSSGIAVGVATNMPSHNPVEAINAVIAMIENPDITLDDIMKIIPGPDLPSGATIIDTGIREAYETGRGSFLQRSEAIIETVGRKSSITFINFPYNVGPEKFMEGLKKQVKAGALQGIANAKDLTSHKNGIKVIIDCKAGFNPEAVLKDLYKKTLAQESFNVNNTCIVNGKEPKTLGLLGMIRHYINHRVDVIERRTKFRLRKAEARSHILEGLIIAQQNIEEVIKIIRGSADRASSRKNLSKTFKLSEIQANAILDLQLSRLTKLEVGTLKKEADELKIKINSYKEILNDKKALNNVIISELKEVRKIVASDRKSKIISGEAVKEAEKEPVELEIPDEPTTVVLSSTGLLGSFNASPGRFKVSKDDYSISEIATTTKKSIGVVTSKGKFFRVKVYDIAKAEGRSRGENISKLVPLDKEDYAVGLIPLEEGHVINMVSNLGFVKRLSTDALPTPTKRDPVVITFKNEEEFLISATVTKTSDDYDFYLITDAAQLLRFSSSVVATKGAPAGAMAGMKIPEGTRLISANTISNTDDKAIVVTVSDTGGLKSTLAHDYPAKGRGGSGVRCQAFKKNETKLQAAIVSSKEILPISEKGEVLTYEKNLTKRDSSGVQQENLIKHFHVKRQS